MNFPKGWKATKDINTLNLNIADKWMLSKLKNIIDVSNLHLENYEFGEFANHLYEFWYLFCSIYIEVSKISLSKEAELDA